MESLSVLHEPITAPEPLRLGDHWVVTGVDAARLRFREVRPGEAFTARDATGAWFRARVVAAEADHGDAGGVRYRATLFEAVAPPESPLGLVLVQAILGRERMLWVVQKATELGVHWILPVFTERSLGSDDLLREKAHRWPDAILRAVRQCRRAVVPAILPPVSLAEALTSPHWRDVDLRWVMMGQTVPGDGPNPPAPFPTREGGRDMAGDSPPSLLGKGVGGLGGVAIAVGPEGGWTEAEGELLLASGAAPITAGGRILRAETAAIVGLTLLQHRWGDMRFG